MLAPMQGLSNRGLRDLFIQWVKPDAVFTEFLQVRPGARQALKPGELAEIAEHPAHTPLVVQLIGRDPQALVQSAEAVQIAGARHINLNLGCPYGRMQRRVAGGSLLREPEQLARILETLRAVIHGSFSLKLRAGYADHEEIFSLLPLIERSGVDFLVIHPRTVTQKYDGAADHDISRRLVAATALPVIANGDIRDTTTAQAVLAQTGAAGLMLGRGAIADPWLFERIRGSSPATAEEVRRRREVHDYLLALAVRYRALYCGDSQVLYKLKEVITYLQDDWLLDARKAMRKARQLEQFEQEIRALVG